MPPALLPDLSRRVVQPELMDEPGLDRARHLEALTALARVNRVSRTAARVWSEIARLSPTGRGPVRVLDVACGGGDVLHDVARLGRRHGIALELHGCDASPVALERAGHRAPSGGPLHWHELDALVGPLPGPVDLVCSTLFLHHLTRAEAVGLLAAMAAVTERVLLVQDLRRTRLGYVLAWAGLHALTRSDVARFDGLASVRAAFTMAETRELLHEAGMKRADVRPCWPQRFAVRWVRA